MTILNRFSIKENAKNYPAFDNKEYRDLIRNSVYHSNQKDRYRELNKALAIINEEVPLTAIYHWKSPYIVQPYVEDLLVLPTGFFHLSSIKIKDEHSSGSSSSVDVVVKNSFQATKKPNYKKKYHLYYLHINSYLYTIFMQTIHFFFLPNILRDR